MQSPRSTPAIESPEHSAEDAIEQDEGEQNDATRSDGHYSRPPRPRGESLLGGSFSSSWQRTPARSYFQWPTYSGSAPNEPFHTARGVREDTTNLASRALIDTNSRPLPSPPPRLEPSPPQVTSHSPHPESEGAKVVGNERPDTIQETPEPTSPGDSPPSGSLKGSKSGLTELIRRSSGQIPAGDQAIETPLDEQQPDEAWTDEPDEMLGTVTMGNAFISQPNERTALLGQNHDRNQHGLPTYTRAKRGLGDLKRSPAGYLQRATDVLYTTKQKSQHVLQLVGHPRSWDKKAILKKGVVEPVSFVPPVILGLLLNILDGLSYGMILFPLGVSVFAGMGPDGLSIFYVSTIISQLVYSLGGSQFKGGIGSEMIEVVPFFHKMAYTILHAVGEENPKSVIATTLVAYCLSSILTGLTFYLLGTFRLGSLIGFFPRHILIGCIGGVGFFLFLTGIEVAARLEGSLNFNLETLKKLFELETFVLWITPLALATLLMIMKHFIKFAMLDAIYFIFIIAIFYFFCAVIPELNLGTLRSRGWVFTAPPSGLAWYHFYTLFDFNAVDWGALGKTLPAIAALIFFGLVHIPINIPALALSLQIDDCDLDREMRAHGISNALSGFCGSIQNYLVYTNSMLFSRSGGNSRVAGVLLAFATFGVLVAGPDLVGFIPVMVVGALIFYLGIDLLWETLVDNYGRVSRLEYLTILVIVLTMGLHDFVVGIGVGIVLACLAFVMQTSQISAIRAALPGNIASSTVRRHHTQQQYLSDVGRQIYVMKLAGYLFFGTVNGVESRARCLLQDDAFNTHPIRLLILDLSKVDGMDYSAAEAFERIGRLLKSKEVTFILCGFAMDSRVGRSICNVALFQNQGFEVEYFETLDSALEYSENQLLRTYYQRKELIYHDRDDADSAREVLDVPIPEPSQGRVSFAAETMFSSPRQAQLQQAATAHLHSQFTTTPIRRFKRQTQPLQLILQAFSPFSYKQEDFWAQAAPFFRRIAHPAGTELYSDGAAASALYIVESGVLRAIYRMPQGRFSEIILGGTTCGELPFFSETSRTATVMVERDVVLWELDVESWGKLRVEKEEVARELLVISLKMTKERMDAVMKYMLLTAS